MYKFIASLAAASVLAATPAPAQDIAGKTVTIRHADLDLASAAGRATLDRRIAAATERACGSYANTMVDEAEAISACRAKAGRQVAAQLAQMRGAAQVAAR